MINRRINDQEQRGKQFSVKNISIVFAAVVLIFVTLVIIYQHFFSSLVD